MTDKITSFKGFKKDLTCRDFQFEIGKTYKHEGEVKKCNSGFHACEYPLSVFEFYPPSTSRFALVEQSGTFDRDDTKIASSVVEIKAELTIAGLVKAAIEFTMSRVKQTGQPTNTGTRGVSSNTGYQGASSNTGDQGVSSNTGTRGVSSNTGTRGVSFNNGWEGSTETSGEKSVAVGVGYQNKGRASKGNWLVLAYRDDEQVIKHISSAKAGGGVKGITPDVWYTLNSKGKFVEVKS